MYIDHCPMKCIACNHTWTQECLQDVAIPIWTAHIKTIHCPKCNAPWKKLAFVIQPEPPKPTSEE